MTDEQRLALQLEFEDDMAGEGVDISCPDEFSYWMTKKYPEVEW